MRSIQNGFIIRLRVYPLFLGVIFLLLSTNALFAEDAPPAPAWASSVSLTFGLTSGNSETLLGNLGCKSDRTGGKHEIHLAVDGNYGESEVTEEDGSKSMETNVQNAKAAAKYNYLFTARAYAYVNAEFSHDDIATIDYRVIGGPGAGYYLLKDDTNSLAVDLGVSFIKDKVDDVEDDRWALRAAERYDVKLGETSKVWQAVEYLPVLDDWGNFLLNAEIGAEAAMNAKLALRILAQDKYNSEPAADKDENDLILSAGITYKF